MAAGPVPCRGKAGEDIGVTKCVSCFVVVGGLRKGPVGSRESVDEVDQCLEADRARAGTVGRGSESDSDSKTEPFEARSLKWGALSGVASPSLVGVGGCAKVFGAVRGSGEGERATGGGGSGCTEG